jgi:hypothetical protein
VRPREGRDEMTGDGPLAGRDTRPDRSRPPAPRPTIGVAAGVVTVVALVIVGAALAGPWRMSSRPQDGMFDRFFSRHVVPPVPPPPPVRPQRPLAQATQSADMALAERVALIAVAVVLLLVVASVLMRFLRVNRRQRILDDAPPSWGADAEDDSVRVVAEGVHAARRALREDVPPGDAVVAAWMALERAAHGSGVDRDPAQTATELTVALLDRTQADPASTRALLDLYLQARFSSHPLTAAHVAAAQEHLARITERVTRGQVGA